MTGPAGPCAPDRRPRRETALRKLLQSELAQGTFEYLLITAVIVAPFILALIIGFQELVPEVLGYVCPGVDTADPGVSVGSCLGF